MPPDTQWRLWPGVIGSEFQAYYRWNGDGSPSFIRGQAYVCADRCCCSTNANFRSGNTLMGAERGADVIGRRIGAACAWRLAREGYVSVVDDRRAGAGQLPAWGHLVRADDNPGRVGVGAACCGYGVKDAHAARCLRGCERHGWRIKRMKWPSPSSGCGWRSRAWLRNC
ncbi:hypothetical protein M8494_15555 [Serratia ureilytica]